jgi:hypothetical protein
LEYIGQRYVCIEDRSMNRLLYLGVSQLVVLGSAFATFYWGSRPLLQMFGISEYANGRELIPLLTICIGTTVAGAIAGVFLIPVILRPFISSGTFWERHRFERSMKIPVLTPALEYWCEFLYGKYSHRQ